MKKKSLKSLSLNKKTISNLSQLDKVKGGSVTYIADTCTCKDWGCDGVLA